MNNGLNIITKIEEVKGTLNVIQNARYILERRIEVEEDKNIIKTLKGLIKTMNAESLKLVQAILNEFNEKDKGE